MSDREDGMETGVPRLVPLLQAKLHSSGTAVAVHVPWCVGHLPPWMVHSSSSFVPVPFYKGLQMAPLLLFHKNGALAQQLRAHTALAGDLSLIPDNTQGQVDYNHL